MMKYEIVLRGQSYDDLNESFLWYSERAASIGDCFIAEVENCLEKIKSNPYSYQITYKNLRRALVRKFPFGIFYLIDENKIIIFAIFHSSRDPKILEKRL